MRSINQKLSRGFVQTRYQELTMAYTIYSPTQVKFTTPMFWDNKPIFPSEPISVEICKHTVVPGSRVLPKRVWTRPRKEHFLSGVKFEHGKFSSYFVSPFSRLGRVLGELFLKLCFKRLGTVIFFSNFKYTVVCIDMA